MPVAAGADGDFHEFRQIIRAGNCWRCDGTSAAALGGLDPRKLIRRETGSADIAATKSRRDIILIPPLGKLLHNADVNPEIVALRPGNCS